MSLELPLISPPLVPFLPGRPSDWPGMPDRPPGRPVRRLPSGGGAPRIAPEDWPRGRGSAWRFPEGARA